MIVGAILYLWNHPISAHAVVTKLSSKIFAYAMETPTTAIIIGSTIKIGFACMRLHVCTWSSGWARFLYYLYELFTLLL
jgi:hypothetical protein